MASASGKIILLGEHAVVYGVPAIAAGIERGASARAHPAPAPRLHVGAHHGEEAADGETARALGALLDALGAPPHEIEITLDIPPGCGLGASAAIAVAAARAVLDSVEGQVAEETPERSRRVLAAADAWERVFHGNPSGIDAAAATYGGCICFTREQGSEPLDLDIDLPLAIAVAGPPASTREMVEGVARLRARRPEVVQKILDGIRSLVQNARHCIEAGDIVGLAKLMDYNQMLLSGLFLSTEAIERACQLARDSGALGAKLTGAGGGGCVVAVAPEPLPVLEAWRSAGLECFETTVRAHATGPSEGGT